MIQTPTLQDWQLSTAGLGLISQGLDDIGQAITLIVTTEKGTDPLRPMFGCDVSKYIDQPLPIAAANMTRAIVDAVGFWEPRVVLTDVFHTFQGQNTINFKIGWQLVGGGTTGSVNVSFGDFINAVSTTTTTALTTFINPTITPVLVKSQNWQFSTEGVGRIVQGIRDIGQSILFIASTMKGTDPLRPMFGCDLFDFIDQPLPTAGPSMARAIREAVNLWEPRVKLSSVKYSLQDERGEKKRYPAGIRFEIGWRLRGGSLSGQTNVFLGYNDDYLNDLLNPPVVSSVFFILATENLDPILTEGEIEILL